MSRPKVLFDARKSKVITLKVSEREYEHLTVRARNANVSVSEFIRRCIAGSRSPDHSVENMYHEVSAITNLLSRVMMLLKKAYMRDEADKSKLLAALEPAQAASEKAKDALTLLNDELQTLRAQDEEVNELFNDAD